MPDAYDKDGCNDKHKLIEALFAETRANRESDLNSLKLDIQKIYDLIRENEKECENRQKELKAELKEALKEHKDSLLSDIDAVKITNEENEKEKRSRQWTTAMLAIGALISMSANLILLIMKMRGQ